MNDALEVIKYLLAMSQQKDVTIQQLQQQIQGMQKAQQVGVSDATSSAGN